MSKQKWLIVVGGPTAVGKTAACISLSQHFSAPIVSADSRQFYREMNLGTAKPSAEELAMAPHYFIDSLSIHDTYDVGQFEKDGLALIAQLHEQTDVVIATGGSGLFLQVLCQGMDQMPDIAPEIREQLSQELQTKGLEVLQEELKQVDPVYYQQVDLQNPQRVIRALEVFRGSGVPFSAFRKGEKAQRPFQVIKIGLERPREELYQRIDARMDAMIAQGLFEEAEVLFPLRHLNALQTVGYSEIFGYLEGKYDKEEAIRLLKRNSRRYAKRQLTWFKKDVEIAWFSPLDGEGITTHIREKMDA
ncbi:tRNA (adenosine(37)-N6)-dimethylallyltransferase MiaA [Cytophagales bacterium LB-30]|uniref:tRNA dimethylallyltransferase n=1 Tax=Shiella aurantiaca TaxID=3058365 RepID=A0ABT8F375_9BACT|nr:tRNA (adenosine(37)-N6)-dimethylallyltransferase MiaA [Shiella aurantiaca]MDN4164911.1 tRNA (adenosine(37)-N6)-dimethylallyltransferase MiaA [Shiella aurantiaca]